MAPTNRFAGLGLPLLAVGFIGFGVLGLVFGDFGMVWQPVPEWVQARAVLAYLAAACEVLIGVALLSRRTAVLVPASRALFVFVIVWVLALKVPMIVAAPGVEVNWNGAGEIAVVLAAAWILYIELGNPPAERLPFAAGDRGSSLARALFGVAVLPIGLAHLVYSKETASMVPAWLPARLFWAQLTGTAHIVAGLGVLLRVCPRLAAQLEAWMIGAFAFLVWLPGIFAAPTNRLQWTAFTISWVIGAGAWVVADSLRERPWIAVGRSAAPTSIASWRGASRGGAA